MNYTFNEKQFLAIEAQDPNVVIIAPAGSGKTSTLIGAIKKYKDENPNSSVVAITFTRKSAEDLRIRLGGYRGITASTIHSWSYQELQNLSERLGRENPENAFKIKLLEDDKIKEILKDICQRRKYYYIKDYELFIYVMGNYNIDIEDSTRRIYDSVKNEYISFKKNNGLYDFTDLPEYLLDKLTDYDEEINHIDALFVDEFQDVDDIQLEVFSKVKAGKKFYIGDPSQCQPSGTKVRMSDGSQKNIEDIQVGDTVVSYYPSESYISGCKKSAGFKVLETSSRIFSEDYLITVTSENGKTSRYTPNHQTFAAIRKDNPYNHLVYLMENEKGYFRIGISKFYESYNSQDMSTFRHKLSSEKYVNGWVLKVFETEKEARIFENKMSYQFGLPQITFQLDKTQYSDEEIDYIYSEIDSYNNAKKLLEYLKLSIDYPFLSKNDRMDFRRDAFRKFYAINLIPETMSILTHDATQPASRNKNRVPSKLIDVKKDLIEEPIMVYSLKISEHETYIADDIVTHNSIYMFRGATPDVINKLDGFSSMGLDMNYRSYQEIIDFASTAQQLAQADGILFSSIMESFPSPIKCEKGYGGEVFILNRTGAAYEVNKFMKLKGEDVVRKFLLKNPMILCRKNKEVRAIKDLGYDQVTTIHQAKGLEYPSVIITDFDISSEEDINIAYVGMTRAENRLLAANYTAFMKILRKMKNEKTLVTSLF